jgi:hypothetical protein
MLPSLIWPIGFHQQAEHIWLRPVAFTGVARSRKSRQLPELEQLTQ